MNSIHQKIRPASLLLVVAALATAQFISAAPATKNRKHDVRGRSRASAKTNRTSVKTNRPSAKTKRAEPRRLAQRRRAEAARLAAIARQRALEDALRDRVQAMIAKDDTAGEDLEIRRIAINALGNHAGTVVVMDPQTGRVYSIVNQQWGVREGFKPCSTIKLVTSLAGLNESVINPADTTAISDSNRVNLTQALAYSKNDYFQQVGRQVGYEKMISYARRMGLGAKTGINLHHESAGRLPSFRSGFDMNRMSSHGDGYKVTALQLATLVSVFANRGKSIVPFIPRSQAQSKPHARRQVSIDAATWQSMTPGMVGAVSYGSGRKAHDPMATVAGKTGTCIENGAWVGLFASYAPLNDPKLAIVVIARGSDGRNHFPAAVAGRIYRELSRRHATLGETRIAAASTPATVDSSNTSAEQNQADDDAEEIDDGSDDEAVTSNNSTEQSPAQVSGKTIWGTERVSPERKVKSIALPISRPRRVSPR
ncbi:MAG: penicillin-binding transpeptidase domain-containing protein [Pyrinomonadaceae bacterium]